MEIQCSSLKNETVIFIIPHTINTITIHVFKIISSIIPNYFQNSFNRGGINFGSSIPFLTFTFYTITHKLVPSNYYRPLTKTQLKLHKEIVRLQRKGLSYRKIHKELIKKGFKIGKSTSTVHSIIKKIEKRDKFLNQPVVEGYKDFDILFYKV